MTWRFSFGIYTMTNLNTLKFKFVLVDHVMLCVPLLFFPITLLRLFLPYPFTPSHPCYWCESGRFLSPPRHRLCCSHLFWTLTLHGSPCWLIMQVIDPRPTGNNGPLWQHQIKYHNLFYYSQVWVSQSSRITDTFLSFYGTQHYWWQLFPISIFSCTIRHIDFASVICFELWLCIGPHADWFMQVIDPRPTYNRIQWPSTTAPIKYGDLFYHSPVWDSQSSRITDTFLSL